LKAISWVSGVELNYTRRGNVFITFTNVFLNFCHVFTFFNVLYFYLNVFLHLWCISVGAADDDLHIVPGKSRSLLGEVLAEVHRCQALRFAWLPTMRRTFPA